MLYDITNAPAPAADDAPILRLTSVLMRAMVPDQVALAASFGRWWLEPLSSQIVLSQEAAALLGEKAGLYCNLAGCLSFVLPEDQLLLTNTLSHAGARSLPLDCEFRVLGKHEGLRWLRLTVLPPDGQRPGPVIEGILTDITAVKHAAMREQFSFESTQLLLGAHSLDEAVSKVIELVCTDLGWDCGMYWSLQPDAGCEGRLVCVHHWSTLGVPAISALINPGGRRAGIAPGEGLVGAVWRSGQPRWIEDVSSDPEFQFPQLAHQAGLRSGYAFPVAYGCGDGRHRPGVLAFFSCLARQRTAQLPNLSAAIGGLIAQTAQRIAQQESIRLLAQTDVLTGLANRHHFHQLLDAACQRAAQGGSALALLYIDLDRFKPINDAHGNEVGDAVLRQFAQRVAGLTPPDGLVGRVGGDEFALFLSGGASLERLGELAGLILQAARARFVIDGRELAISACVGGSLCPENGASGADLLRHAEGAMQHVKRNGRNGVSFCSHGGA